MRRQFNVDGSDLTNIETIAKAEDDISDVEALKIALAVVAANVGYDDPQTRLSAYVMDKSSGALEKVIYDTPLEQY